MKNKMNWRDSIEAKNKLEEMYVRTAVENPKDWNLDFDSGEITINY